MIVVDSLDDVAGKIVVCTDRLFVKLLSQPRLERYELVPGWYVDRWEAVAQVNNSLCVVELTVKEM